MGSGPGLRLGNDSMTPAIVSRRSLLKNGHVDRLDPEFFDRERTELEEVITAAGGKPLSHYCEPSEARVEDPKRRATTNPNAKFHYVEISGIDSRDGFVVPELLLCAEAPSRARMLLVKDAIALSSVRPIRNQVFLVPPDLDRAVGSTGLFILRVNDALPPEVVFAFLKTRFAVSQLDRRARASMYPTLYPPDVLDILVPPIEAGVRESVRSLIREASEARARYLDDFRKTRHLGDDFFAQMGPSELARDLRKRGHRTLKRSELLNATGIARIDAEFYAPAFEAAEKRMREVAPVEPLRALKEIISTGRGLAAGEFSEQDTGGPAVIKVGSLTGLGLRWSEVPFAPPRYLGNLDSDAREGDVIFNSTAHQPLYLAHKTDVISGAPETLKNRLSFVSDLMRVRLKDQDAVPPHYLAAFLRNPLGQEQIKRCIRGTSSHVYPSDIENILVPIPPERLAQELSEGASKAENERRLYSELVVRAVSELEDHIVAGI